MIAAVLATSLALSSGQVQAIELGRREGARHGFEQLLPAVFLHESSLCANRVGTDGESLGCGQMRPIAACDVDRRYCRHANETRRQWLGRVRPVLERNDRENARLSSDYLAACRDRYGFRARAATLVCYAIGPGSAAKLKPEQIKRHDYVAGVDRAELLLRNRGRAKR